MLLTAIIQKCISRPLTHPYFEQNKLHAHIHTCTHNTEREAQSVIHHGSFVDVSCYCNLWLQHYLLFELILLYVFVSRLFVMVYLCHMVSNLMSEWAKIPKKACQRRGESVMSVVGLSFASHIKSLTVIGWAALMSWMGGESLGCRDLQEYRTGNRTQGTKRQWPKEASCREIQV